MNNLDTLSSFETVDAAQMRARLAALPQQCAEAYAAGRSLTLPASYRNANRIVIAGMGGPGIGAALAQALYAETARVPIAAWRDYGLPGFAQGPQTLVIASSTSGNTEEVLDAFGTAAQRGCAVIALAGGGALAQQARALDAPLVSYTFEHQPREAIGWHAFPLIALLAALGVIDDPAGDVAEAVAVMEDTGRKIGVESPAARNPAKRMAGQVVDRLPIIYGAGMLAPVARRWKTVLNENAKLLAACDEMPDLNHNSIEGLEQAEAVWQKSIVIQLRSDHDHPRVSRRFDTTTRLMLEAGINQDTIRARGKSALAQQFSLVQFGDWVSYYAAIMSGVDPTPVRVIGRMKEEMAD
jgi:glucose/mannose-6-phosphate isomerase